MGSGRGWMGVVVLACALTACTQPATEGRDASTSTSTSTSDTSFPTSTAPSGSEPAITATTAIPTIPTTPTTPTAAMVDQLTVRGADDPPPPTYRRDAFGDDWAYDPSSGCNIRERVLAEESLSPPTVDDRCRPTGTWRSAYDGLETSDPADLQIDHLVALADAWRSGAWTWDDDRRFEFANDLTDPATLIAVSGTTNQSKGDSSPDQWMPPDRDAWCPYAADWVAVKSRWKLTVTAAEKATLVAILNGCP